MNRLTLVGIYERGIPNKERVAISVAVEVNLTFYALIISAYTPGRQGVLAGSRLAYWFNPLVVKPGDWVVLYSGTGVNTTEKRTDGGTNHFFHWGLPNTVWDNPESCAILCELNTWTTK
jgi:hypothetical protein